MTDEPPARPPGESRLIAAGDIRALTAAVTRFATAFETALRRLDPPLTLSQLAALDLIAERDGVRPFRLAVQMGLSRQLAWQTARRLERLGLVEIQPRADGRRGVDARVSASGRRYLDQVAGLESGLVARLEDDATRPGRIHGCRRLLLQISTLLAQSDAGQPPADSPAAADGT